MVNILIYAFSFFTVSVFVIIFYTVVSFVFQYCLKSLAFLKKHPPAV